MNKEANAALDLALMSIEKAFGKGAYMYLTDEVKPDKDRVVSSSCTSLDVALGIGGYPKGRLVEIYGPESSGKTTLCLHAIAECQANKGVCAFIDAEHALDPIYASNLGVDLDNLIISQPSCGEEALDIVNILARSGEVQLIVIDSVAALIPRKELEGEMGDSSVGAQARLMSKACRMLGGVVAQANCIVIFTNQIRMKIGVMFGSPETTSGGNALKFYASQRLDIRRIGDVKVKDEIVGNRTKVKIVKNKVAPPKKVVEFDIVFGKGINQRKDLLEMALDFGFVKKSGSWWSYGDQQIGQGSDNACLYFDNHQDVFQEIRLKVLKEVGMIAEEVENE